jgi:hypothetical protein
MSSRPLNLQSILGRNGLASKWEEFEGKYLRGSHE